MRRALGIFPRPPAYVGSDYASERERNSEAMREYGRALREDDERAVRLGFPEDGMLRPGYYMRIAELAERMGGDPDVPQVIDRLAELHTQIAAAREEARKLKDVLDIYAETFTGWRSDGAWRDER